MKTKLNKKWQPSENFYRLSDPIMPREWIGHQLGEWKLYWLDCKETKKSWDLTFWNWCKRRWEDVDKRRMYQEKRKVLPAAKPGKISKVRIREAIAMTREKRQEFADYLNKELH